MEVPSYDGYDSLDDDDDDNTVDESDDIDLVECMEDLGSEHECENEEHNIITSKQTFHGMRIYEKINAAKINNYFKININNKPYCMHKQTAARLLTSNKSHLSSDRRFRVKQTNKQH